MNNIPSNVILKTRQGLGNFPGKKVFFLRENQLVTPGNGASVIQTALPAN
jgi:hypothetical protein